MGDRVVIVGAGPSGLLTAHYLLRRDDRYRVAIYERRGDPRRVDFSKARTYPISLNDRALAAMAPIEGLESAVRSISREMTGTIIHQRNGKTRVISQEKPRLTLDRTHLAIALLDSLTRTFEEDRLQVHFNARCTEVDLEGKTVYVQDSSGLSSPEAIAYDWLIGADGSRSQVRTAFLGTECFEFEQKYAPNDYKSIFLSHPDRGDLQPGKIHSWRNTEGLVVLLLHQIDGTMSGVIHFPHLNTRVTDLATPSAVEEFFRENFPEVGRAMTEGEAADFLARSPSRILTVRCSHYHYRDSVLIIGDAAHAVSPSIGQGCNASLEDVVLLNRLLDEFGDDRTPALSEFTARRREDAHALVELGDHTLPLSPSLFLEFILRERFTKLLHGFLPDRFPRPLSGLLFESTVPYAEILRSHRGWIDKVKRSNPTFSRF